MEMLQDGEVKWNGDNKEKVETLLQINIAN